MCFWFGCVMRGGCCWVGCGCLGCVNSAACVLVNMAGDIPKMICACVIGVGIILIKGRGDG